MDFKHSILYSKENESFDFRYSILSIFHPDCCTSPLRHLLSPIFVPWDRVFGDAETPSLFPLSYGKYYVKNSITKKFLPATNQIQSWLGILYLIVHIWTVLSSVWIQTTSDPSPSPTPRYHSGLACCLCRPERPGYMLLICQASSCSSST